jgi:DNA polymerase III subunit delta
VSAPVVLLTGHEFLVAERLRALRDEAGIDPLAEIVLDSDASIADLTAALGTPSLLGGTRLVVVEDVESLGRDQMEVLTSYVRSPSTQTLLVLVARGRTRLAPIVAETGEVEALEAPRGRSLVAWLRRRARARDLRLDDRAGWALVDAVGSDPRDLDGALDQLRAALGPDAHAGAAEVRRAFPRLADERIYAFTDAVGDRRLNTAMEALRRLLEQGDEPLVVFGALVSQMRRMLLARAVADDGTRAVRDALGLPEWRAERVLRQARSYREEELASAMSELAAADVDMKSGDLTPEVALERAVVTIVGA